MTRRALLGLIGARIGRSISPAMHEAAGAALGLDVRYHLIDSTELGLTAADLPRVLDGVRSLGFAGTNVTHPFKEAVVPLLDTVEGAARLVGAVNTVVVQDGKLIGHNTDHSGFLAAWRRMFGPRRPGCVALIGAGGVGRAMAFGLLALGTSELRIVDLDQARATGLAEALAGAYPKARTSAGTNAAAALAGADGVVNATPVGTYAYPGMPVPETALASAAWAADAIYTPLETHFIAASRRAGLDVLTGQELAIGQAIDAFALFFGRPAPAEVMRATFEQEVRRREVESAVSA